MTLEPFKDFKIDLNASRTVNKSRSIQYQFDGIESQSGNFNMTVITIGSAFGKSNAGNGYHSKTFDKFLNNLDVIQKRVEAQYSGAYYPSTNNKFDASKTPINKYSPDVMIPAFLAAYTGRNSNSSSLDFFPKLFSMMPNWKITYSGLSKLDFFKRYFKSFNINHGYRSLYSVGSYNTYQSFLSYMGDIGFIRMLPTEVIYRQVSMILVRFPSMNNSLRLLE